MPGVGRFYPTYGERQFWSHVHSRISQQLMELDIEVRNFFVQYLSNIDYLIQAR